MRYPDRRSAWYPERIAEACGDRIINTPLLTFRFELQAEVALSTLGEADRRLVETWIEYIRHWHDNDFARSRSRRLKADEELYVFETKSSDLLIAFSISGTEATILSIFRKEWLRHFQTESSAT
jgi:hypothetical protein